MYIPHRGRLIAPSSPTCWGKKIYSAWKASKKRALFIEALPMRGNCDERLTPEYRRLTVPSAHASSVLTRARRVPAKISSVQGEKERKYEVTRKHDGTGEQPAKLHFVIKAPNRDAPTKKTKQLNLRPKSNTARSYLYVIYAPDALMKEKSKRTRCETTSRRTRLFLSRAIALCWTTAKPGSRFHSWLASCRCGARYTRQITVGSP